MSNVKSSISGRLLAALLSVLMVFSMFPLLTITAFATTTEHPDSITVTVKDEEGKPVSGAEVDFRVDSIINGVGYQMGTPITDEDGTVEIMQSSDYVANDLTVTATISKSHYREETTTISGVKITSDKQDFSVELQSTSIKGVNVTATSTPYDGEEHDAATISGIKAGDVVSYKLGDNEWQPEIPKIKEPNTYSLDVKVVRSGYEDYTATVAPVVSLNTMKLTIIKYKGSYDAQSHPALSVTGLLPTDTVLYTINGVQKYTDIPQIRSVGKYTVTMHVERYGYKDFDATYEDNDIEIFANNIDGLSATAYSGTYDGENHGIATVGGTKDGDKVEYSLDNEAWSTDAPQIKDYKAGGYEAYIRVTRNSDNGSDVQVIPVNAYILKANQTLSFRNTKYENGAEETIKFDKDESLNSSYDFSAIAEDVLDADIESNPIVYTIKKASDNGLKIDEIATIDQMTGELIIKAAGCVTITAQRSGNGNYNDGFISYELVIYVSSGSLVSFENTSVDYTIGENDGCASDLTATNKYTNDNGACTYSIDKTNIGLAIDAVSGRITISNYQTLAKTLIANEGKIPVIVTVNKTNGTESRGDWKKKVFEADSASYTLNISFLPTPSSPYILNGTVGTNDWYTDSAEVTATDSSNFAISKTCNLSDFGANVIYSDQGEADRYIYLRNIANGGITSRILLDGLKIDTEKPDSTKMKIEYSKSPIDTFLEVITLGFYNPSVTIRFTAEDVTSGVDHFNWTYSKKSGESDKNKDSESGVADVTTVNGTTATAEITLTASETEQYHGNISITATDKAGNKSNTVTDTGNVFVVDTINPTLTVRYAGAEPYVNAKQTINGVNYFNGDVEVELTVKEDNFHSNDTNLKVSVSKDGGAAYTIFPTWTDTNIDEHIGKYTFTDDGDYIVYMSYEDRSGNNMTAYTSETITIDKTNPKLDFSYNGTNQSTTFTVTEHNFRAQDISVATVAKDITGADVTAKDLEYTLHNAQWSKNGDVYTTTVYDYVDGIYDLTISYTDISTNKAKNKKSGAFTIDHAKPTGTEIEYSTSIIDTVLETLTLGFYNPSVTVKLTAYDTTAGVDYFIWDYTKQSRASSINHPASITDTKIDAVQDNVDKTKFTAQFVLSASETEQYRGYLAVTAIDKKMNTSDKKTDSGNILVVDTISPRMFVEYSESSRSVGKNMYYNKAATATFIVTESNFFKEDVKVTVSKNGGTAYDVVPTWFNTNVDVHVGKLILPAANDHSNDGDYVISVIYKDRSNNTMDVYTSDTITIDTINPTVAVAYSNKDVKNTLPDSDNNNRQYFVNTQTATITVTEHNFNADEVNLDIIAKDVTGAELNKGNLLSQSEWTTNGDNHTIIIKYSGDANYTFDVSYTDLAANEMADYSKDYFTVDRTAPTNLTVSYSNSILDTVLESISFGFYNAKMTVTVTADDATSIINSFNYSYIKATGVSLVNADLRAQAIAESEITYSNDNKTATTKFDIPKMVLRNDNQFNGTVEFTAKDRSGNSTKKKDAQRIVVDNISPTAQVTYNQATNIEGDVSYYDGNIEATVTIDEANFYSNDVRVMVSKNGGNETTITPSWTDNSVDVHAGRFTLSGDGEYIVTINYKDKSSNSMKTYTSKQMIIDTEINKPTYRINNKVKTKVGGSYRNDTKIDFTFTDQNFDSSSVKLIRTRFDSSEDVTEEFITVLREEKGGSGSFTIPKDVVNDGIYTLTVGMTDKAKHSTESYTKFTINRYGSVYEYSDYLVSLIKDGGKYITVTGDNKTAITDNLVITEYNAERLLSDSVKILITRDGKEIEAKYDSNPTTINARTPIGESGWYQYMYTIDKTNFTKDGVYKISLASAYATTDSKKNDSTSVVDNSIDEDGKKILDSMKFTVDTTAPEIRNVVNLDKTIADRDQIIDGELTVKYTIIDVGGLKSVDIIANGKTIDTISDFGGSAYNYSGKFVLKEDSGEQTVQLKVTDLAGNVTDTSSEGFDPGELYVFNDHITVSTNFLVRWNANKPLFWGSIGGVLLLVSLTLVLVVKKRKKANV